MKYIIVLMLLVCSFSSFSQSIPKIFIVHSYDSTNYKWTASIQEGFIQRLAKDGLLINKNFTIVVDMLNVHKFSSPKQKEEQANRILKKIESIKPDYIVTTDDDALAYVGVKIKNTPVVFNGINKSISYYFGNGTIESKEKPGNNITGIYQTIYYKQSIEMVKRVSPKVRTYAFIADNSTTSLSLYNHFQKISPDIPLKLVDIHISNSAKKWKSKLTEWKNKVDVIITGTPVELLLKNKKLDGEEAFKFLVNNTNALVLGNWVFHVEYGALLSIADSGHKQGWFTGDYILKIMNGERPGNLPIISPEKGLPTINLNELKKRKLDISKREKWNIFENGMVIEK